MFTSSDPLGIVCFWLLISAIATVLFEEGKVLLMSESLHASAAPARFIQLLVLGLLGYLAMMMFSIEVFTFILAVSSLIPAAFVHRFLAVRFR